MCACRFAVLWSGAVLVVVGLCGADRVDAQPQSKVIGCPSFHEVHADVYALKEARQSGAPPGFKVYPGVDERLQELLRIVPIVSGGEIAEASTGLRPDFQRRDFNQKNRPVVWVRFDAPAARRLADFTARNVEHSIAIVLDGRVIQVLRIISSVTGEEGEIDPDPLWWRGRFTFEEANDLVERINSGGCQS
jgi:preprotein translocase subunit SecD